MLEKCQKVKEGQMMRMVQIMPGYYNKMILRSWQTKKMISMLRIIKVKEHQIRLHWLSGNHHSIQRSKWLAKYQIFKVKTNLTILMKELKDKIFCKKGFLL